MCHCLIKLQAFLVVNKLFSSKLQYACKLTQHMTTYARHKSNHETTDIGQHTPLTSCQHRNTLQLANLLLLIKLHNN